LFFFGSGKQNRLPFSLDKKIAALGACALKNQYRRAVVTGLFSMTPQAFVQPLP